MSRAATSTITRFAGASSSSPKSSPLEWFAFSCSSKKAKGGKKIGLVCGVGLGWGLNTISSPFPSPIPSVLTKPLLPFPTASLGRYLHKMTGICSLRKLPSCGKKFVPSGALKNQLRYWLSSWMTKLANSPKELNG